MNGERGKAVFVRTLSDWISGTARLYALDRAMPYRRAGDDYDGPFTGRASHAVVSFSATVNETIVAPSNLAGDRLAWCNERRGRVRAHDMLAAEGYDLEGYDY